MTLKNCIEESLKAYTSSYIIALDRAKGKTTLKNTFDIYIYITD